MTGTEDLARAALKHIGPDLGELEFVAEGMSSAAWKATVGDRAWVARVPKLDGLRPTARYADELRLLDELAARGVPVATGRIVAIGEVRCAVSPFIADPPVSRWTDGFVADLAAALATLHTLPPSAAIEADIVARFHLATIWPFDDTDLAEHPLAGLRPDLVDAIERRRAAILVAGAAPATVVHTDLHWDHLLQRADGRLSAMLDFGDAFAGAAAWDLCGLEYYHGRSVARRVLAAYPGAAPELGADAQLLGIAWALYKLAKTPSRTDVQERAFALIEHGLE